MGTATRMLSYDTYISERKPTTNFSTATRLGIKSSTGTDKQFAFIHFSRPFPLGAKIVSATLTFNTYAMPETGNHTITVARVASKFSMSRVNYQSRPTVDATGAATVTKTGALPGGQEWVFDVTKQVQKTSDGVPWYGWRVATSDPVQRWIYAEETASKSVEGPRLTVVWADDPDEPQSLTPNEGTVGLAKPTLSFEHVDVAGDVTLAQVHVQTSSTTSFASPIWDSGPMESENGTPSIDLAKTSYPGAPAGQRVYYRIRVMDGAGLWSDWSAAAWFTYLPRPSAAFTSFDPADPKFWDSTPNISWTMTGGTQSAYRVTIARTRDPKRILWDSGKITSSENVVQVPSRVLRVDDATYRVVLRLWDTDNRISVPGANAYLYLDADVFLDQDQSITPVDWVTVTQVVSGEPRFDISWDRAASADEYEIARQDEDGEKYVIGKVSYEDSLQPDGTHRYRDASAPPGTRTRYIVRPVTNGRRSGGRGSDYFTYQQEAIWLVSDEQALVINGSEQGTWNLPESATAHQVIGATAPTVIREVNQGYVGSLSGLLIEEDRYQPGLSLRQKRDRFFDFKVGRRSTNLRLIAADLNIPVQVSNLNTYPTPDVNPRYECSFDFHQDGEVWWSQP